MKSYAVFGGRLRSPLDFPDLSPLPDGDADWALHVAPELPALPDERLVGAHPLGSFESSLYRGPAHVRLHLRGLGDCVIAERGRQLLWVGAPRATPELVRAVILGPVLAIALQLAGTLCLHGSAVAIDGRAVAFLAPKHHGKSTLAMALVQAGARLVTDDALAVDLGPAPTARPGVHSVRLQHDAAQRVGTGPVAASMVDGVKRTFVAFPREAVAWTPVRLAAVYLLAPVDASATRRVRRTPCTPGRAAIELAVHGKVPAPLLGIAEAGAQLQRVGAVVRAVPVHVLHVPRDFALLPNVVRRILAWHRAPRPRPSLQEALA